VLITSALLGLIILAGCSPGWAIAGHNLDNSGDSTFVQVIDVDSLSHIFERPLILKYDAWCLTHNQFEIVNKK